MDSEKPPWAFQRFLASPKPGLPLIVILLLTIGSGSLAYWLLSQGI